ncbi:MAG: hypothetical protein PHO47_08290 [Firmicutes bacterium]|nr:hypothetical protein [Bacillota bacterium]
MPNMLTKTNENDSKIHKRGIIRGLVISATLGAWTVFVLAIIWLLAAIGWYLLARLWWQELFVPDAVSSIVGVGIITLLWAVLLGCSALLWANYHKQRYYKSNRRQLLPLIMESIHPDDSCFSSETSMEDEVAVTLENIEAHYTLVPHENLIIGTNVQEDFKDEKGKVVLTKGEVITPEIIDTITARGLYGIFVVHLSKQVLETIRE